MKTGRHAARAAARDELALCVATIIAANSGVAHAGTQAVSLAQIATRIHGAHVRPSAEVARAPRPGAANTVVTSCADDGGFDTFRHFVLTANPGDTIDLSGATCGTIALQSGAIAVDVSDLTIVGPGKDLLTIDAHQASRVFNHSGNGTLTLSGLTVANGKEAIDKAMGGCIYSMGSVSLKQTTVTACSAVGQTLAAGGAIVAKGDIDATLSTLSDNLAKAEVGVALTTNAVGGAVLAFGDFTVKASIVSGNTVQAPTGRAYAGGSASQSLTAKYSTFTGNKAIVVTSGPTTGYSAAGALSSSSATLILGCTLDHNAADLAGAVFLTGTGSSTAAIALSTISTNTGNLAVGAIETNADIIISNSTIAFNDAGDIGGPAVLLNGSGTSTVDNSILADNSPLDLDGGGAIDGANDLIKIPGVNVTVPVGTIAFDPQLGPLQFNGGYTRTHALPADSPAIDQGDNSVNKLPNDQRGPSYPRAAGLQADIGAFELDPDHVFGNGFSPTPLNL